MLGSLVLFFSLAAPPKLPLAAPESVGLDGARLARIDAAVEKAIAEKRMPGCVVLVARKGAIAFHKAYGVRALKPTPEPMTPDTIFDMASVTKPVATGTSILLLAERGVIRLADRYADHLPGYLPELKEGVTIAQLLTHTAGFIPDNPIADYQNGADAARDKLLKLMPRNDPGTKFVYSDVGFQLLGELVRIKTGKTVAEFAAENVFIPLGMTETGYLPPAALKARAATTQEREGRWMKGEVHDPRAYAMGGVAGHAGLFSTATDLAVYAQMMHGRGAYQGVRVMGERTFALMTTPRELPGGILRAYGWDAQSTYSSNRGETFSRSAFGHGGFTGTGFWIDPELELTVVFLSNRVHPDGKGSVNPLIGRIGTIAASSILSEPAAGAQAKAVSAPPAVGGIGPAPTAAKGRPSRTVPVIETGLDVLVRSDFKALAGKRIALVTNHTGLDAAGRTTIDLLHETPRADLKVLFSPEHGIRGELDVSNIADGKDAKTGLPIFSLYGKTRKPTAEMLKDVDVIVYDIQDVGARFYTYISTLGLCMEAAAENKKGVVVLDRPNPIGGVTVAGPMLDAGKESFVGYHRIPVQHGMTIGELAQLFKAEKKLDLDLQVVTCVGWRRGDLFDVGGLTWTNPSPNMRCLTQAMLYPGIGLLETTNLSVGRGTDTPFEVVGAPWIDGRKLATRLNLAELPGVRFVPIRFTPKSSKFANEKCAGVNIIITDRAEFKSVPTGFAVAAALRDLFPGKWEMKGYLRLLGNEEVHRALSQGQPAATLARIAEASLGDFAARRQRALLYQGE
ncbi:MAG TPA: exo-beta-N-acetylmuramidase NamZ domain-containing protein [Planctomycetia bacterium]|nr:exo-beta-N-acetylmuramidase NamZ domain-containing protein [Planctomycetia bacterium]